MQTSHFSTLGPLQSDQFSTVHSNIDKLFRSALAATDVRLTGLAVHSRHLTPCSAGFCVGRAGVTYPGRPMRELLDLHSPLMDARGREHDPLDV
jgi:hypothetical protein